MNVVEGDEGSFEGVKVLFRVDLDEGDRRVSTSFERIVLGDIVEEGFHGGYFERESGLFAEGCGHVVKESEECERELCETR